MIRNAGPHLVADQIDAAQRRIGVTFTEEYRNFLLEHNGGRPDPNVVDVVGLHGGSSTVHVLFGIGRNIECENIEWNWEALGNDIPINHLPIGCDPFGNCFSISCRPEDAGGVFFVEYLMDSSESSRIARAFRVATSFGEFIGALRPLSPSELESCE